jgi:hypothetical protein
MSEKSIKKGESGWIAEEIFGDATLNMRSKCLAIDDQIDRGVLNLEEALEVYEVSAEDYLNFYIKEQSAQAEARFHGKSLKFRTLFNIKYLNTYFHDSTRTLDSDLIVWIGDNINKLEDDVAHGRVKVISE